MLRTSVSRLTSIARCGLAYQLERVQQLPALPAGWLIQGIAIHDACDAWEKSARQMPICDAQDVFESVWYTELTKADEKCPDRSTWLVGGRKKVENDLSDRYDDGLLQVADYITANLNDKRLRPYEMPDGSPASEMGFEIQLGGVDVRGYFDLLLEDVETGELLIRDIKSGSNVPLVPFQLQVYRLGLAETLGLETAWGHYYMTKKREPGRPRDLTRLDREWIEGWFAKQVEMEQQGLFIPNPGDACRTCGVRPHCPLMA